MTRYIFFKKQKVKLGICYKTETTNLLYEQNVTSRKWPLKDYLFTQLVAKKAINSQQTFNFYDFTFYFVIKFGKIKLLNARRK